MAQILFTPIATEDLRQIWIYIAENAGSETANRFLSEIKNKCETIAEFPESGRARHEFLINLRSFPFKKYVVFYLPLKDGIEVLRIIHGSRDIEQVFDEMIPLEP
ncbi:type II toxin-antitoxin system RelE/ParE family toxin [soil metagenome]